MGAGCSNPAPQSVFTSQKSLSARRQPRTPGTPAEEAARKRARETLMHKCFSAVDIDGSGTIEVEEWKSFLVGAGVPKEHVEAETKVIMMKMDTNKDNRIQLDEFVVALHDLTGDMSDAQFAELLAGVVNTARSTAAAVGVTGSRVSDGATLSPAQVRANLAAELRVAKLRLCFEAMDADKSGFIDLDEFRTYVSQTGTPEAKGSTGSTGSGSGSAGSGSGAVLAEAGALLAKMDGNGDKQVSEQEFMCAMAEFRHTVSDAVFGRLVEGVFSACAGQAIASNVLKEALQKAKLQD